MNDAKKTIQIYYHAILREERGKSQETLETNARTALDLYKGLKNQYNLTLETDLLKVAINEEYADWGSEIKSGDSIIFIPPVAGG